MRDFLPICFNESNTESITKSVTEIESIDPFVWVLIALIVIGVILSLSVWAAIIYRQHKQRELDRAEYERTSNVKTMDTLPIAKSDYQK